MDSNNSGGRCDNSGGYREKGGKKMTKTQLIHDRRRKHLCIVCGEPTSRYGTGWYSKCDKCRAIPKTGSICWGCANAIPSRYGGTGCSWSENRIPVEGWTAVKTEQTGITGKPIVSYCVIKCPQYKGDKEK